MPRAQQHVRTEHCLAKRYPSGAGILITMEEIEQFLALYETLDRAEGTVKLYRRKLTQFYQDLPEDKRLRHGFMESWRGSLLKKYQPASVNASQSAVNAFLDHIGHREYQLASQLKSETELQPELTRAEYLRLLQTARTLGREKVYLLVKLFGTTGLSVQELSKVTVEAVTEGKLTVTSSRSKQVLRIPEGLQKELLDYGRRNGYLKGPLFLTREGTPMSRTYVTTIIRQLCEAARIPGEKGNPRCLKRLYQSTRSGIEENIALLVEQAHARLLEQEQLEIGWSE